MERMERGEQTSRSVTVAVTMTVITVAVIVIVIVVLSAPTSKVDVVH